MAQNPWMTFPLCNDPLPLKISPQLTCPLARRHSDGWPPSGGGQVGEAAGVEVTAVEVFFKLLVFLPHQVGVVFVVQLQHKQHQWLGSNSTGRPQVVVEG